MKPPPRQRTKTHPSEKPASKPQRLSQWSWIQQRRLLRALEKADQDRELDYSSLAKSVRTRSCSEVTAAVEALKERVIAIASLELKKKGSEDTSDRKPIEMWTSLASTLAGANQEPISKAFSQVFLISSIEPRTQSHSHRPSDSQPASTAPPTPLSCSAVRATVPKGNVLLPQKRPLRPEGESVTPPFSSVAAAPPPSAAAAAPSTSAAAAAPSTSAAAPTASTPSTAAAAALAHPTAAAAAATDGQCAPKDAFPSVSSEACSSVDFEKIYNFLSTIQSPDKQIELTPMEGAILLDLLMSLPEELPHLNCKKLQEHLNQVFQFLIAPADCSDPSELFQSLREVASSQQGAAAASCPQTDGTNQQPAAPGDVTKSLQSSTQPGGSGSQSAASCSGQSGGTAVVYPPLNPFLVPAELLMKK